MRLRRLDLTRYGKFTGACIDFGARTGDADLHIIYGPNEAGKSTAFSAFLDLLFGIEMQSRYNFLHGYATMRIGACLELSSGTHELIRIKSPRPTLRNAADEPVPEAIIQGDLAGLDRAAYRAMFSLDDDTLESGGNSILASRGELGQLLFSASAGLSELSAMLAALKAKTAEFAKQGSRSSELTDIKKSLVDLKAARDAIDTGAADYARLAAARDLADSQYAAAIAERAALQAELETVQRQLAALPRLAALQRQRARLLAFGELPDAPQNWLQELPGLQDRAARLSTDGELADAEVQRLTIELNAITPDEPAQAASGRLRSLAELRARHVTADLDLPQRRREHAATLDEIRLILARLGRPDEAEPSRLLLDAAQSSALASLMETRSGIAKAVDAANDELSRALLDLEEARQARHEAAPGALTAGLPALTDALAAWRESDHANRLTTATRAAAGHEAAVSARLAALAPWQGDAAALAATVPPHPSAPQALAEAMQKTAARLAQTQEDVERLETELARREAAVVTTVPILVQDAQDADLRAAREVAWATHRRTLDASTADAFEAALRRDDLAGSARQRHEQDRAKRAEEAHALSVHRAETERARARLNEVATQRRQHLETLAGFAASAGVALPAGASPAWLLAWMENREKALEEAAHLAAAQRGAAHAADDAAVLCARLREGLRGAGLEPPPDATPEMLAATSRAALDGANDARRLANRVTERERDVRGREREVQKAATSDKAWRASWQEACDATWLGGAASPLPIATVRETMAVAAELGGMLKTQAGLADRIRAMEEDQAAFLRELQAVTNALGLPADGRAPTDLAQAAIDRVEQAGRDAARRREVEGALASAEAARREVQAAAQGHAARAGEMMAYMGASSLIELGTRLHDARTKADLRHEIAEAETGIAAALRADGMAAAEALLAERNENALEEARNALQGRLDDLEPRSHGLFAARSKAADAIEAIGGDDAAARIEAQRKTVLLDLEDKVRASLRLRLGIAAAERALRAYRDQHRSAMLNEASDAFRTISRGAYRGLGTQPDREGAGDVLVALGADGGSKLAADLSKGTRFQLYLALRAAGYREFAKLRRPVPFIADDIMETFDDFRAEETLRVLHGMAWQGQVIYLTHHDHLRDMAVRTVPGVRVHELRAGR